MTIGDKDSGLFTRAHVISRLREIVQELGPDFIYKNIEGKTYADNAAELRANGHLRADPMPYSCNYVHTDENDEYIPGCIAGRVFYKDGADLDRLVHYEGDKAATIPFAHAHYTPDACTTLTIAQTAQDRGLTYGQALQYAIDMKYPDEFGTVRSTDNNDNN